ncbi:glycerol-3-phosphate transporter ATP-binding subunit [Streptobacillus moniliformis]|nr:glycerol-3-phosphate transporter ATP-binding subunit [Streptobacillus moniliformis]
MNIMEGYIKDAHFISDSEEVVIKANETDKERLREYEGKRVSLGIRSERFLSGDEHENRFAATIEVIEMLGKEKLLYCKLTDGTNLVVTMPGHYNYEIGEVHNFGFDTEALHFFDENGNRI